MSVSIEGEVACVSQPVPNEQSGGDIAGGSGDCSARSNHDAVPATASEAKRPFRSAAAWSLICHRNSLSSVTTFGPELAIAAAVLVASPRVSSSESHVLVGKGIGPATGPASAAGIAGNSAMVAQAEPKRIGGAGGPASQSVNCCQTLRSNERLRLESVSGGPARASEVPAQMTRTTANPRLEARRSAMKAPHLTVDTGNPNAIDFSLKEFSLEIVIDRTATRRQNTDRYGTCLRRTLPAHLRSQ
ncbi:hypothetical protein PQR34_31830 [Paraburkholderia sediminicola]|uniref:hypothetical protein n=1 Tax=Paraburkholderia sediminicola TaxID=458836 RepID=UPI0038B785F2